MDDGLKQRLVGAIVLVALAIIFLPMLFDEKPAGADDIQVAIPPKPDIPQLDLQPPQKPERIQPAAEPDIDPLDQKVEEILAEEKLEEELADKIKKDANKLPITWSLQVGSFKERAKALALRDRLRADGYNAYIQPTGQGENSLSRVLVGPELTRKSAEKIRTALKTKYKLDALVVRFLP